MCRTIADFYKESHIIFYHFNIQKERKFKCLAKTIEFCEIFGDRIAKLQGDGFRGAWRSFCESRGSKDHLARLMVALHPPLSHCICHSQGVWKKGDTTNAARPTIWLYMLCRRICRMYNYRVYNNLLFLIQMEYRLQSMYNHWVGRAVSIVSPFYFKLLGQNISVEQRHKHMDILF